MTEHSAMSELSRDPEDLVSQTIDGITSIPMVLFLGTLLAPVEDRDVSGEGFPHQPNDVVTISAPGSGRLTNVVGLSTEAPEWIFGSRALRKNLTGRGHLNSSGHGTEAGTAFRA